MVGLVIVSHSKKLAESLVELVKAITPVDIPVVPAGGLDDNPEVIGTDAQNILNAIESVYSNDGVLVLMDMGSAILSAELAIDLLDGQKAQKILLCPAPIVEGAISAAAQISIDADLEQVYTEAMNGLAPKQDHFHQDLLGENQKPIEPATESIALESDKFQWVEKEFLIKNVHGLHARPAAKFVQLAGSFKETNIVVTNLSKNKGPVSAISINKIASLGINQNEHIKISAKGKQPLEAINALGELIAQIFGEDINQKEIVKQKESVKNMPIPISEGIGIGTAYIFNSIQFEIQKKTVLNSKKEIELLKKAISNTQKLIEQKIEHLKKKLQTQELDIFNAHLALLLDPELFQATIGFIEKESCNAEYAWESLIQKTIKDYKAIDNEYIKMRSNDVRDIGNQVLEQLTGQQRSLHITTEKPVILFVDELTPSETVSLDLNKVQGIVTKTGGSTSHTAILARSLGIPAISGYTNFEHINVGDTVIIDGFEANVYVNPDNTVTSALKIKKETWETKQKELQKFAQEQAITLDKKPITILANIGSFVEVDTALRNGAEGIGLLRTEFLFLEKSSSPTEEEQYQELVKIIEPFYKKPITVRTLDIGGDKFIPYIPLKAEENPFLGVRGIRLYQNIANLFTIHIRAILRAAAKTQLEIMFPMVSQLEEYYSIQKLVEQAHIELENQGIEHAWPIKMGIMVETPSAVMMAKEFAQTVDFFSIGTNDLTQYIMAAERGNPNLSLYADPMHPAVLRSIKHIVDAAREHNIPVSICGEMAGDINALPILIGLQIDKLSMNSPRIPAIKQSIRTLSFEKNKKSLLKIFTSKSSEEVRTIIQTLV